MGSKDLGTKLSGKVDYILNSRARYSKTNSPWDFMVTKQISISTLTSTKHNPPIFFHLIHSYGISPLPH